MKPQRFFDLHATLGRPNRHCAAWVQDGIATLQLFGQQFSIRTHLGF